MTQGASAPDGVDVSMTAEPDTADLAAVKAGLAAFNARVIGVAEPTPVAVFARRDGVVVGGATGHTQWEWLFVEYLWVSEEFRGEGLGAYLLERAEATARERGCVAVWLDTFSFQAPAFYERFGYRPFGRLDGFPPGHSRHFVWKPLA